MKDIESTILELANRFAEYNKKKNKKIINTKTHIEKSVEENDVKPINRRTNITYTWDKTLHLIHVNMKVDENLTDEFRDIGDFIKRVSDISYIKLKRIQLNENILIFEFKFKYKNSNKIK